MNFEWIAKAWNIGRSHLKSWLFAVPTFPANGVVESMTKSWSLKGW